MAFPQERWWKPGQSGNPKGRPSGALGKRTQELRQKAKERGCDPVEVMLDAIVEFVKEARKTRHPLEERLGFMERACTIAKDVAPYIHPKLASVELSGNDAQPIRIAVSHVLSKLSPAQIDVLEGIYQVLEDADATGRAEGVLASDPEGSPGGPGADSVTG